MSALGKTLIMVGGILAAVGVAFLLAGKVPLLGNLPGDLRIETDGGTLFIPLTTCLVLSLVLTLLLNLLLRLLAGR